MQWNGTYGMTTKSILYGHEPHLKLLVRLQLTMYARFIRTICMRRIW